MQPPLNPSEQHRPQGISRRKFVSHAVGAAALTMVSSHKIAAALDQAAGTGASRAAWLRVDASKAVNSFDPDKSLGSSMDELSVPVIEKIYTPEMVRQWLSAGWGPITYRNHTELAIEAWHWNSNGKWSDAAHQRGLLCRGRGAHRVHSRFIWIPAAASRHDSGRRRFRRLRAAYGRRSCHVLEEQSVPHQGIYRRRRRAASAMDHRGLARSRADQRPAYRLV